MHATDAGDHGGIGLKGVNLARGAVHRYDGGHVTHARAQFDDPVAALHDTQGGLGLPRLVVVIHQGTPHPRQEGRQIGWKGDAKARHMRGAARLRKPCALVRVARAGKAVGMIDKGRSHGSAFQILRQRVGDAFGFGQSDGQSLFVEVVKLGRRVQFDDLVLMPGKALIM